jgi:uncharacterized repeat protein (TIGR01451 family)
MNKYNNTFILLISLYFLSVGVNNLYAQSCASAVPSVIAKWEFTPNLAQCNGAIENTYYYVGALTSGYSTGSPVLSQNKYTYCPTTNLGCGSGLLGSPGHINTPQFNSSMCLYNFYSLASEVQSYGGTPFDATSTVWNPSSPINLYVTYDIPLGKVGCLSSFALKILQKQFNGTVNFEKQGMSVYRNDVLIYSDSQPILAANINSTPISFAFPGTSQFCSDGSSAVRFRIVFGLIHRLVNVSASSWDTPAATGYDDICILGTCGGSSVKVLSVQATPSSCTVSNGKFKVSGFGTTDKYAYTIGASYTGSATYASGSTAIPSDGIIASTLPNPTSAQSYTVRIFTPTCYTDEVVTLPSSWCPSPPVCIAPTGGVLTAIQSTCSAANVANADAQVQVTGVTSGNRAAISVGSTFTGGLYANATALSAGAYTFTGLPNPTGTQDYTVRVYNATDYCVKDYTIALTEKSCGPCKTSNGRIYSSNVVDLVSTNNYAPLTVCTNTQKINLNLTKSVAPSTGTACPTNTNFVWTITINNTGDMAATDIQVSDLLPVGLVYISNTTSAGTYSTGSGWLLPTLAANASATLTLTTKALTAGTFTNIAEIMTAFPLNDPNSTPGNRVTTEDDYATASITVTGSNPPSIAKEFSPMLTQPNAPTRLTIKLYNNEITPVILTTALVDVLPTTPGQMVIAATPNLNSTLAGVIATAGATSITVPNGTVLLPGLNQIQVDVTVPTQGTYCNNIVAGALKTSSCDNLFASEACLIANPAFKLAPLVKKTMLPAIIQTGQNATLTLTVENRNSSVMTLNQNFIDYLPTNLVLAGAPTSSCASLTVTAQNSNKELKIASGGTIPANTTCTITVPVTSSVAGDYCNVIVMNGFITTVGANNNLGNEDISEACITVTATPCTTLSSATVTPASFTVPPNTVINLNSSATGTGNKTIYQWSSSGGTFSNAGMTSPNWTAPATDGTYQVTLTLSNRLSGYGNCPAAATVSYTVVSCTLTATATKVNALCKIGNTGTATAIPAGAAGAVTYLWSNGQTTATATALIAGAYTVTVSESPTCTATATATVGEPTAVMYVINTSADATCYGNLDGSLSFTASGGIGPYTYSIDNGVSYPNATGIFSGLRAAIYKLAAKDANGCVVKCP